MSRIILFLLVAHTVVSLRAQIYKNDHLIFDGTFNDALAIIERNDSTYTAFGVIRDTLQINDSLGYWLQSIISYELDQNLDTIRKRKYKTYDKDIIPLNSFRDNNDLINLIGLRRDTNLVYSTLWWQIDAEGEIVNDYKILSPGYPNDNFISAFGGFQDSVSGKYVLMVHETSPSSKPGIIITDADGNVLLRKTYQPPPTRDLWMYDIQPKINSSNYIMIGENFYINGPFPQDRSMHIIEVDSVGNVVEQWDSSEPVDYGRSYGLIQLSDGGLVVAGAVRWANSSNLSFHHHAAISLLDSNKNFVWTDSTYTSGTPNQFLVLHKIGNSYVAMGHTKDLHSSASDVKLLGLLHKTDPNGNTLWSRNYQHVSDIALSSTFEDMVMTPDSGFLIVGYAIYPGLPQYQPPQRGYIVKTDRYGCVVPDCQLVDTEDLAPDEPPFELLAYPNPASERLDVFVKTAPGAGPHTGELLDATGRTVRRFAGSASDVTYLLDVADLPAGVYFLRVTTGERWVRTERVVVQ